MRIPFAGSLSFIYALSTMTSRYTHLKARLHEANPIEQLRSSRANAHPTCSHMPHIYTYACTHMGTLTGIAGRPSANLWKNPPPMNHNPRVTCIPLLARAQKKS